MFQSKTVVITGAASGIGKALTELFLNEGAVVWAVDREEAALTALAIAAKKRGSSLVPIQGDVTQPDLFEDVAKRVVTQHGRLDFWINNAGIAGLGEFQKLSASEFEKVIDINLRAVVTGTRVALRSMDQQGAGTIVNVASVAGHIAPAFMTAYCTSKYAVVGFTRSLREELRLNGSGVKLCLVSPGFVDTAILAKGQRMGFPQWLDWLLATPQSVAKEILRGLKAGKEEIFPTRNGRMILRLKNVVPGGARHGAKILMAKSFKDLVANRYRV